MDDEQIEAIVQNTPIPNDISQMPELLALQILYDISQDFMSTIIKQMQQIRSQPGNENLTLLALLAIVLGEDPPT